MQQRDQRVPRLHIRGLGVEAGQLAVVFAVVPIQIGARDMVFAAAHGSLAALLPLFIFGCVLVFIYEKTGSIWAPIAVHFCFNGATVALQLAIRYFDLPVDPNL